MIGCPLWSILHCIVGVVYQYPVLQLRQMDAQSEQDQDSVFLFGALRGISSGMH